MRNRNTIEYLGLWETLHNANFNPLEFDGFRKEAGLNAFTLSPTRWIEATNAIGLVSKSGRYGGTYAISDIAFKFAVLINDGIPQGERLVKLNQIAIQQMQVLEDNSGRNLLK